MKHLLCLFFCFVMTLAFGDNLLRPEQDHFMRNQRYIASKDLTTLPGYVIIHFARYGKPDGCVTQKCFTVTSGVRKNPFMYKMIDLTNNLHQVRVKLESAQLDLSNLSNRFETVQSKYSALKTRNQEARASLDELIQKAPLLKSLIERIKEKIAPDDDDD